METEVAATAGNNGSLSAVGHSLANVGTATKAFAIAHPIGLAAFGGALLGFGAYYAVGKAFKKKETVQEQPDAVVAQ